MPCFGRLMSLFGLIVLAGLGGARAETEGHAQPPTAATHSPEASPPLEVTTGKAAPPKDVAPPAETAPLKAATHHKKATPHKKVLAKKPEPPVQEAPAAAPGEHSIVIDSTGVVTPSAIIDPSRPRETVIQPMPTDARKIYLASYKTEMRALKGFEEIQKKTEALKEAKAVFKSVDIPKKGHFVRLFAEVEGPVLADQACNELIKAFPDCGSTQRE